jgi:hypothetical protein
MMTLTSDHLSDLARAFFKDIGFTQASRTTTGKLVELLRWAMRVGYEDGHKAALESVEEKLRAIAAAREPLKLPAADLIDAASVVRLLKVGGR